MQSIICEDYSSKKSPHSIDLKVDGIGLNYIMMSEELLMILIWGQAIEKNKIDQNYIHK